ncbi:unnamed protein product [Anisakis simplex]|uniref:Uncharacterized protein n=1 Tax=Anisakis simplex TaxID=6269 RepID=A0A0M3JCT5_ANISI|nr:unnamed protein product [Anisakis simplex]
MRLTMLPSSMTTIGQQEPRNGSHEGTNILDEDLSGKFFEQTWMGPTKNRKFGNGIDLLTCGHR